MSVGSYTKFRLLPTYALELNIGVDWSFGVELDGACVEVVIVGNVVKISNREGFCTLSDDVYFVVKKVEHVPTFFDESVYIRLYGEYGTKLDWDSAEYYGKQFYDEFESKQRPQIRKLKNLS